MAVNSQYVFWGNARTAAAIGRANISGSCPNPALDPRRHAARCLLAAAPSNKITFTTTLNKKKGTAKLGAQGARARARSAREPPRGGKKVKPHGLTLHRQAARSSLAVKPKGKAAQGAEEEGQGEGEGLR